MRRIPLFPLPVVLLPGAVMPLHIFEPRYRQMTAHCLEGDRRFGLLYHDPDRRGPFDFEEQIGCVAELMKYQPMPDGRSLIIVHGGDRFQLRDEIDSEALYYEGLVEAYVDLEADPPGILQRREHSRVLFERVLDAVPDAPAERPQIDMDREAAFQMAKWFRIDPGWHQELIELRFETQRLDLIDDLLEAVLAHAR
jgi:Lon protease-like protein